VRVFPDTNLLASAFGTRGLCADLLRLILAEHELVTGEVVLEELRRVLFKKFGVLSATVARIEAFLREYHVEPKPVHLPKLKLGDRSDLMVVTSAFNSKADVLLTGDRELLELKERPSGMRVVSPRGFWRLVTSQSR
jgi:putative PIN family toxin of toxin-antitoxin system